MDSDRLIMRHGRQVAASQQRRAYSGSNLQSVPSSDGIAFVSNVFIIEKQAPRSRQVCRRCVCRCRWRPTSAGTHHDHGSGNGIHPCWSHLGSSAAKERKR